MITFNEYIYEHKTKNQGVYASIKPDKETMKKIRDFAKDIVIDNPLDSSEYHTTIIYSKTPCQAAYDYKFDMPMEATFKEWKIFVDKSNNSNCLVMILDCPKAAKDQKELLKLGAKSDYPDYQPHITLSYNFNKDMPKEKPKFKFNFDKVKVEPLKENWVEKVNGENNE